MAYALMTLLLPSKMIGPLLILIVISIDDKPDLTRMDWFLMTTFTFSLIAAFFIIIPQNYGADVFWLVVSCITYLPVCYLPWHTVKFHGTGTEGDHQRLLAFAETNAQRFNLAILLIVVFPIYIVVYFVALFKGIGPAETIVGYQILSIATKGLFVAGCMDLHLELMSSADKALLQENRVREASMRAEESRANEARRNFMKFIFHEVSILSCTYTYMYIYIYICLYVKIYLNMYIHMSACAYMYIFIHQYINKHLYT
jgi:hypothetical protein